MSETANTSTVATVAKEIALESVKTATEMMAAFALLGAVGTIANKLQARKAAKNQETPEN